MAKVDKRWWFLSVPVVLLFGTMCCCGGGGVLWWLISSSEKVIYTSTAPSGEIRLDIMERKSGAWNYELVLKNISTGKELGGTPAHLTTEKKAQWGAEWLGGTCVVTSTEGGVWIGSHSESGQSWISFNSK
jgi:hypothetical protein